MSDSKDLGTAARTWLRDVMRKQGLSQSDVSVKTGVTVSTVSRLLDGAIEAPRRQTIARLSQLASESLPPSLQAYLDERPGEAKQTGMGNTTAVEPGIPIWGVVPDINSRGMFRLNPYSAAYLGRNDLYSRNPKLIAFYAPDDSMSPRWFAGEPIVVDTIRSGRMHEPALIEVSAEEPDATELRIVRIIASRRDGRVTLESLDGAPPMVLALERVVSTRHVMTWQELVS